MSACRLFRPGWYSERARAREGEETELLPFVPGQGPLKYLGSSMTVCFSTDHLEAELASLAFC